MKGQWISERFPQFEAAIRDLVQEHLKLEDESLHLALVYLPRRDGRLIDDEIFLFEVIGGMADNWEPNDDFLENTFVSVPAFPTGFDQPLHIILMSERDVAKGIEANWSLVAEIADAVRRGDYKVLHEEPIGRRILRRFNVTNRPRNTKKAARG